jgi:hypothetical protein
MYKFGAKYAALYGDLVYLSLGLELLRLMRSVLPMFVTTLSLKEL